MKKMIIFRLFLFTLAFAKSANAVEHRDCIILLDRYGTQENIARSERFYLVSKLQSALAEKAAPLLVNVSLWNAFMERRTSFKQALQNKHSQEYKVHNLYHEINKSIARWSHFYTSNFTNGIHAKSLITQRINEEFYAAPNAIKVSDKDYQLLINHLTYFNAEEWSMFKNNSGFYLLIPKEYSAKHPSSLGFKCDALQEITAPEDVADNYFDSQIIKSLDEVLSDFFITHDDVKSPMPYAWNIILSGHGGADYQVINNEGVISWLGQPIIANLSVQEFKNVLAFFETNVKTHLFHYASCHGSGNHAVLLFGDKAQKPYNFAIIADTLTDSFSTCKFARILPSDNKKYITSDELSFDDAKKIWHLPLKPEYYWTNFFDAISMIDFSLSSLEHLPKILSAITFDRVADISMMCLPGEKNFFPVHEPNTIMLDDQFLELTTAKNAISVHGMKRLLIESEHIHPQVILSESEECRFVSVKPGNAIHHFQKLTSSSHVDLPSAFWQAEGQLYYDKIFIIDEFTFPHLRTSLIFKDIVQESDELTLTNVIISQQKNYGIRLFFTVGDKALMVCAYKDDEFSDKAIIQEVVTLSASAKNNYEEYYTRLKNDYTFAIPYQ